DTGKKCLYLVDDSFDSAFPDFDYSAAKRGSFREFREKSQAYFPENEGTTTGIDELDFSGESDNGNISRWQKDAEQYIIDAFKAEIPDKLLTREEEQELAKRMKSDMDVIVRALYSDMAKVVSKYLHAISPQGEGSYFRSLLPEDHDYCPDEDEELIGNALKGSARDIYGHYTGEISKTLGEKGLEAMLKGRINPIKALASGNIDPEYVRYTYNSITLARRNIQGMSNRQKSAAAKNIGFRDYKDMEKKMSTLDRFIESYTDRRNIFMTHNLRWVMSIASRFKGRGLEYADLIQEGSLGSERAAVNFDPDRGTKFSTYCTWWIKQKIHRAIQEQSRTIRVPVHLWPYIHKTRYFIDDFNEENGRDPTLKEIHVMLNKEEKKSAKKKKTELSMKKVLTLLDFIYQEARLDAPAKFDDEGEITLGDTIECSYIPPPDEHLEKEYRNNSLREAMTMLTPREEMVLRKRFGIGYEEDHTLEEVGADFEVTRERIRQIEAKALKKMPENLKGVLGYRRIRDLKRDVKHGNVL
ncbi:MAG: sigma-70 family RNA polymerase sigma factor, partial [Nanoarchaeota archaeon]|nr:sigma-70 family RNA polymerase sigma factor [Nanoarchaeota archaeon]